MYILTPDSVFWFKQEYMTFWQKSLYWIPMILHFTLIWAVRTHCCLHAVQPTL